MRITFSRDGNLAIAISLRFNPAQFLDKTYTQYKNRMKILRSKYQSLADLLRFSSGFGWDPETKRFTASDEVWNTYLQAHQGNAHLRNESFEDFEELRIIFSQTTATGKNAVGLGDAAVLGDAVIEDGEDTKVIDSVQVLYDAAGVIHEQASVHEVLSAREKLPPRKKSRTDAYNSNKVGDEVTEISSQIFGMIQKRWEKEAEDKANNVWDAIKEVPDLDDDLHYDL
ncbi:unnamed protein product [Microthlaspi erraticum]|uniref:Uncharacterized protein n=1 Tax=Microthlaspi erraticum TaxID=1685480 RepID=A0A6D2JMW1_9BRAS|nr:unnamed protein product [Microthlaspi erraticum]